MKNAQSNKLNMFRAVAKVHADKPALVATKVALANAVTKLSTNIGVIESVAGNTETPTTGSTEQKNVLKLALANKAAELAGDGFAYADSIADFDLKGRLQFKIHDLRDADDNELISRCKSISNSLNNVVASLGDYNITAPVLAAFDAQAAAFNASIGDKSIAKNAHSTGVKSLSQLFSETSSLLRNQMDKLMLSFKTSNVDYYNTYKSARTIIDLGGNKGGNTPPTPPTP